MKKKETIRGEKVPEGLRERERERMVVVQFSWGFFRY